VHLLLPSLTMQVFSLVLARIYTRSPSWRRAAAQLALFYYYFGRVQRVSSVATRIERAESPSLKQQKSDSLVSGTG
jgi:hypothetical protein